MKTFRAFQMNFQWMRISENYVPFARYEFMRIFKYTLAILCVFMHLAYVAETNEQRVPSILLILAIIAILTNYLSYRRNSQKIFIIYHRFEQMIDSSE